MVWEYGDNELNTTSNVEVKFVHLGFLFAASPFHFLKKKKKKSI